MADEQLVSTTYHAVRLSNGEWTPTTVTLAGPGDMEWSRFMDRNGWQSMATMGGGSLSLGMDVWCRKGVQDGDDVEPPWYLVELSERHAFGNAELALCDRLPDLMDVLSRWTPVVRDAALLEILADATGGSHSLSTYGDLAMIAAHVRHGMGEGYEELRRDQAERARRNRARRG